MAADPWARGWRLFTERAPQGQFNRDDCPLLRRSRFRWRARPKFLASHCGEWHIYRKGDLTGLRMLLMKPGCECCDRDLPADEVGGMICSFECTFCADCAASRFGGACPNCGGALIARPTRTAERLQRHPASTVRVVKPHEACAA